VSRALRALDGPGGSGGRPCALAAAAAAYERLVAALRGPHERRAGHYDRLRSGGNGHHRTVRVLARRSGWTTRVAAGLRRAEEEAGRRLNGVRVDEPEASKGVAGGGEARR
jgi:hypothetical protein